MHSICFLQQELYRLFFLWIPSHLWFSYYSDPCSSVLYYFSHGNLATVGNPLIWAVVLADIGTRLLVIFRSMPLLRGTQHQGRRCCKSFVASHVDKHGCKGVRATHLITIIIVILTTFLKRSMSISSVLPRGVLQDVRLIIPVWVRMWMLVAWTQLTGMIVMKAMKGSMTWLIGYVTVEVKLMRCWPGVESDIF